MWIWRPIVPLGPSSLSPVLVAHCWQQNRKRRRPPLNCSSRVSNTCSLRERSLQDLLTPPPLAGQQSELALSYRQTRWLMGAVNCWGGGGAAESC